MSNESKGRKAHTLEVGYWVALSLRAGAAPLSCYVGQIEATDERGVRITLVDWIMGTASGYDLFVPWSEITAALVATPEQDEKGFAERASKWQQSMAKLRSPEPAEVEKEPKGKEPRG